MQAIIQGFCKEFYRNIIVEDRWIGLLKGLGITLEITVFAIIIGTVLGLIACLMVLSKSKILNFIAKLYIGVIRGTPVVVQLLIIYFGIFGSVDVPKVLVAIVAFGLNSGAYMAEIFRAGILAVSSGQTEASRSLGFTYGQTMRYVIMPQAFKNIIPTYASEFIVLVKETAIVGYIALEDLAKMGDVIRSRTFSAYFPLLTVAVLYLCITSVLTKVFSIIERRLRINDIR